VNGGFKTRPNIYSVEINLMSGRCVWVLSLYHAVIV